MNKDLTYEIVKHVFANLAIIPSNFININKTKSLISKEFLLPDGVPFSDETGKVSSNQVWGCQFIVENQEVKLLVADCKQDQDLPEYALLVWMKDMPIYGVYLTYHDEMKSESLVACGMDGKQWMECPTYLQGTFLSGMEQLKNDLVSYQKCTNYKDQLNMLISFIGFHMDLHGDGYEGKED
jgi:hypothetical protein